MKYYLVEQAIIEDEFGDYEEAYYVGEWRDKENIPSAKTDFNVAMRWNVNEDEDIWIVNTTDGRFRQTTTNEDIECREWQAPLGNIKQYL